MKRISNSPQKIFPGSVFDYSFLLAAALTLTSYGDERAAPSQDAINGWVHDLGADRFAVREEATRELVAAGAPAVAAVATAAQAADSEVRSRAFQVLVQLGCSDDRDAARPAVRALWRLESAARLPVIRKEASEALARWAPLAEPMMAKYLRDAGVGVSVDGKGHVIAVRWDSSKVDSAGAEFKDLAAFRNLTGLTIMKATSPDLSVLLRLPELTCLRLENIDEFELDELNYLRRLSKLLQLELSEVPAGDVKSLPPLASLQNLTLRGPKFTDDDLKNLPHFPSLRYLNLSETNITNAGLAHLVRFENLIDLHLTNAKVDDAGLVHLAKLRQLQFLYLDKLSLNGQGLRHLTSLPKLVTLSVNYQKISNEGVAHLGELSGLKTLNLSNTNIDDTRLMHISKLSGLESLHISGIGVTDQGLAHVSKMTNLRILGLDSTSVTEAGVMQLRSLSRLEQLGARGTQISQRAADELRKSIPKLSTSKLWSTGFRMHSPQPTPVDPFRKGN